MDKIIERPGEGKRWTTGSGGNALRHAGRGNFQSEGKPLRQINRDGKMRGGVLCCQTQPQPSKKRGKSSTKTETLKKPPNINQAVKKGGGVYLHHLKNLPKINHREEVLPWRGTRTWQKRVRGRAWYGAMGKDRKKKKGRRKNWQSSGQWGKTANPVLSSPITGLTDSSVLYPQTKKSRR